MTDPEIKLIEERTEKATPGEWDRAGMRITTNRGIIAYIPAPDIDGVFERSENLEFIAHARTDIPALLDERKELKAEIRRLQERERELEGDRERLAEELRKVKNG